MELVKAVKEKATEYYQCIEDARAIEDNTGLTDSRVEELRKEEEDKMAMD